MFHENCRFTQVKLTSSGPQPCWTPSTRQSIFSTHSCSFFIFPRIGDPMGENADPMPCIVCIPFEVPDHFGVLWLSIALRVPSSRDDLVRTRVKVEYNIPK